MVRHIARQWIGCGLMNDMNVNLDESNWQDIKLLLIGLKQIQSKLAF